MGVFFRLVLRQTLFGRGAGTNLNQDGTLANSAFFGQPLKKVISFFEVFFKNHFLKFTIFG